VAYFHENQLTYPVRQESERDWHFAFTNLTTALAADAVWFNSAFHRDSFLSAAVEFLGRMPDYQPVEVVERIRAKSSVRPPGVKEFPRRGARAPGPLRILWAARWEHDKNPETFFEALRAVRSRGVEFRVSVVGESFRESPGVFDEAKREFGAHIDRWGYQESRADYEEALCEADVIVSTADHEFFGISVVEAVAAGAYPLVPERLAYPEIIGGDDQSVRAPFFYDGSAKNLADMLAELAERAKSDTVWQGDPREGVALVSKFHWSRLVLAMDDALGQLARRQDDRFVS
jgi:glycosyltransferase involved in cell wall biosynthesis